MTAFKRFRHAGLIMVRASTDPGDLDPLPRLALFDPSSINHYGRAWLAKLWARPDVRGALELANRTLADRITQLLCSESGAHSTKDVRRAIVSVATYMLRWQRRATPFGVFAGVDLASTGPASAGFGARHQAVARPDGEWLTALVDRLEQHPGLRPRLSVIADSARIVRDGRVITHRRADLGAADPGPLRESSVRLTRPVRFVLTAASAPVRIDALTDQVTTRFSSTAPNKIHTLLNGLVDAGLLVTSLRAPMTTVDTLTHLTGALRAAGGAQFADIAALLSELDAISSDLAVHNCTRYPDRAASLRRAVVARMTAVVSGPDYPLAVDTRLDTTMAVPERVLEEAALAASVLLRVTTQPFGSAAWMDYHARFRARYGHGALVPVRDLTAESGLGYPAGYLGAPRARPVWRMLTDRDTALLALIQRATSVRAAEIELTDDDIEALTVGDHTEIIAPPRVELGVTVWATSPMSIDRGDFRLRVTAAPRTPTSMAGRFAHMLDATDRARLAATYAAEQNMEETIIAQVSFPPRRVHNQNVTRVEPPLSDVISLSEHPDPARPDLRVIGVDDLAVTADADQMYLIQRSTGRRVVPHIPHALDTIVQTPPLARFLAEVADARSAVFAGLDLGAARTLPYVPRIRYRRTVLAPARWIVASADMLVGPFDEDAESILLAWRRRWRAPARVVLRDGELRLPLDLDEPLDRALLLIHLNRAGRVELEEDGPAGCDDWVGRPLELLIPMTAITPHRRPVPPTATPVGVQRPGDSSVLVARLWGNPARFDDILTTHLPGLVAELDGMVRHWWIRRHRDLIRPETDHHLAVSFRLTSPDHYGPAAAHVARFAADLEKRRLPNELTLTCHAPHTAHYGHGPALDAAEHVFETDTLAALSQITLTHRSAVPSQALAAASMAHLAASFAPDPPTGYRALLTCLSRGNGPIDRQARDHALRLSDPNQDHRALRALPEGQAVITAWNARSTALHAYHRALTAQRDDPTAVLHTLLHEHHVRAVGMDPDFENQTGRLARAVALRHLALNGHQ